MNTTLKTTLTALAGVLALNSCIDLSEEEIRTVDRPSYENRRPRPGNVMTNREMNAWRAQQDRSNPGYDNQMTNEEKQYYRESGQDWDSSGNLDSSPDENIYDQ